MRTLIVGIGALGGTVAARMGAAGLPVWLATRTAEAARALRSSGLRVSGVGGAAQARSVAVSAIEEYLAAEKFDLILLATKARDALEVAPRLAPLLSPGGALLPIQNGGVSHRLLERIGGGIVVGGLSNLGATMLEPGVYEQGNAGHLLIGEIGGGLSGRVAAIAQYLNGAVEVRVTPNMRGAIWAKLLLNCSVTTIGAVAGQTMRRYTMSAGGREVFRRIYDETLSVALASGAKPERMIVDPVPPGWRGASTPGDRYQVWIDQILAAYGDLKPSMLQDFERGKRTEIDFINGYVAQLGREIGTPSPLNAAVTAIVHAIENGREQPGPGRIDDLLRMAMPSQGPYE